MDQFFDFSLISITSKAMGPATRWILIFKLQHKEIELRLGPFKDLTPDAPITLCHFNVSAWLKHNLSPVLLFAGC